MKDEWEVRREAEPLRRTDCRSDFERDYGRVLHSAAFRRLQAKTQIIGVGESDFYRTRLTHSLEVAQISMGIRLYLTRPSPPPQIKNCEAANWLNDPTLIETIGLAHDIGNTPFGHGGEYALNYMMRNHGGFEGNGQTIRLLARLEAHTENHGLNLTRRTLLGLLKYPVLYSEVVRKKNPEKEMEPFHRIKLREWKPPKCILDSEREILEWILEPFPDADQEEFRKFSHPTETTHGNSMHRSLDASIMELADDIAYGVHDLEDGIAMGLVKKDDFSKIKDTFDESWARSVELLSFDHYKFEDLANGLFGDSHQRKIAIGSLVHAFIASVELTKHCTFEHPLLDWQANLEGSGQEFLGSLKKLVIQKMIMIPGIQTLEYRGQQILMQLFEAIDSDPKRFLKEKFRGRWEKADSDSARKRVVCDYIAEMTDEYATKMYERMFMPREGSIFGQL